MISLPIKNLHAHRSAATSPRKTKDDLNYWLSLEQGTYDTSEKVAAVTEIYTRLGLDVLAQTMADAYFAKGFEALENLPLPVDRKNH